jgi:hypothetical protein
MDALNLVTYCGLYCGLCTARARIPAQAAALRDTMAKDGWEFWGNEVPGFSAFWPFLCRLSDVENACPGCRQGGGPPFCSIRKCAVSRGIDVCAHCDEYPCHRIQAIAKGYPTLLADAARMRELGVEAWVREQDTRAATGFAYADIRCPGYEVPRD